MKELIDRLDEIKENIETIVEDMVDEEYDFSYINELRDVIDELESLTHDIERGKIKLE